MSYTTVNSVYTFSKPESAILKWRDDPFGLSLSAAASHSVSSLTGMLRCPGASPLCCVWNSCVAAACYRVPGFYLACTCSFYWILIDPAGGVVLEILWDITGGEVIGKWLLSHKPYT